MAASTTVDDGFGLKRLPIGLPTKTLEKIIDERREAVKNDPELKVTDRWDQSDVFYATRKRLDAMGYDTSKYADKDKRKDLTKVIKEYCDKLGIKRHDIGIFAADRAVLAFRGQLYSVSFENYEQLANLGTDIICVEKEGIVDKLVPFTTNFGIALLQSQGFISEFGEMLAQKATKNGAHVAILTDFDSSGILLAFDVKNVTRIGIGLDTIDEINQQVDKKNKNKKYKQLDPLKLSERYKENNHWTSLYYLSKGVHKDRGSRKFVRIEGTDHEIEYRNLLNSKYKFSDGTEQTYIEFIRNRRIELNTVENEIKAQRFWEWLKSKILEVFPDRDYTRVIDVPDYVLTPTIYEFFSKIRETATDLLSPTVDAIYSDLADTKGLLNVKLKESEINQELTDNLLDEPKIQKIDSVLTKVMKQL